MRYVHVREVYICSGGVHMASCDKGFNKSIIHLKVHALSLSLSLAFPRSPSLSSLSSRTLTIGASEGLVSTDWRSPGAALLLLGVHIISPSVTEKKRYQMFCCLDD